MPVIFHTLQECIKAIHLAKYLKVILEKEKQRKREKENQGGFLEMSRIRFSLAGVFMLILLGMFSAVAFAAGGTTNLPKNVGTIDNFGNQMTHRTHGDFQNNTNSCANCHSTHNGQDSALLMKSGEYALCMSCHDGTLGFYNVSEASEAGIFDDSKDPSMSASMHHVDSDLAVGSAPGANVNQSTATFECSGCHNPHGSSNDRILNEKVNGNQYGWTYDVTVVGYTETIKKVAQIPLGTKSIDFNLTPDPEFSAINSGSYGFKIYKSAGVKSTDNNSKLNYSAFCAGCHDDYLKNRENGPRELKSKDGHDLYTHTTSSTKQGRSCVACHYPHGTDITTLQDTAGKTIADYQAAGWTKDKAKAYMKDVSATGSNNKKFTNMAVCWACHQSTHTVDTQGTSLQPGTTIPGSNFDGKAHIK